MDANLVTSASELGQNVRRQHFGIAAGHVDIKVGKSFQIVQCIVKGNGFSIFVIGIFHLIGHLNFINEQIVLLGRMFYGVAHARGKFKRVAVFDVFCEIECKRKNVGRVNALVEKVLSE